MGEGPRPSDSPPAVTPAGGIVLYHGTSPASAVEILDHHALKPDDLGCVGVGTSPAAVRVFGIMKAGADSVVLRLVFDPHWLANARLTHEVGGSGHDQFLLQAPHRVRNWDGVPPEALLEVAILPNGER